MAIKEKAAGVAYDGLVAGAELAILTNNVTIASGQNIKRGALLSVNAGKYAQTAKSGKAVAVAAEDVDASGGDTVCMVYVSGYFNREKLIAASGDTVTAHEEELRDVGILLSSLK